MRLWIPALAAAWVLCTGSAWAAQSPWQQVWKSETAPAGVTMVGQARTMTVDNGRSLSATAEVHVAQGKVRLDYRADGRQWSLVDDGKRLLQLHPSRRSVIARERPALAVDRDLAERNYTAREAGGATIAGRPVTVIELVPRHGGPVIQKLWLDRETGFALKRERYSAEGRLVSATEYLEVGFRPPVDPELFEAPAGWKIEGLAATEQKLSLGELGRRLGFEVRPPRYLPRGYELLGGYDRRWGRGEMRSAELRYTDGLRVLSVFERQRTRDEDSGRGRRDRGRHRRGHDASPRGRGRGGSDRGEERRGRRGTSPSTTDLTVEDRGTEKIVRYVGPNLVVLAVGDLAEEELVRVVQSVD